MLKEVNILLILVIFVQTCHSSEVEGALRLYGSSTNEGILQIYLSGGWRQVCERSWSAKESLVACRQLGFSDYFYNSFDTTTGYYGWLGNVYCNGDEAQLIDCFRNEWYRSWCGVLSGYGIIKLKCGLGIDYPLRPSSFPQFTIPNNYTYTANYSCADIVFLVDFGSDLKDYYPKLIELAKQQPIRTNNCTNRYGFTVLGVTDVITAVPLNGTSYFGTVTQLNTVLLAYSSQINGTVTNETITTFEGINRAIGSYEFREGVERKFVLIANEPRIVTSSSTHHTYENTLLNLLKNRIALSVITSGVQYFDDKRDRLVGINFNNRVGIGKFLDSNCSTHDNNILCMRTTDSIIQSGYELNYKNYIQLAWNTNGTSFDLSYFNSQTNSYCSVYAAKIFSYGITQAPYCNYSQIENTYSYSEVSINGYTALWTNIKAEKISCVDMVFLLDRTSDMEGYIDGIRNLTSLLPESSNNCTNRYGLVLFDNDVEIQTFGSRYWGTPHEISNSFVFNYTERWTDGYLAIEQTLKYYSFRNYVRRHIVLISKQIGYLSLHRSKSWISSLLLQNDIIFSVITEVIDYFCLSVDEYYVRATILGSSGLIGFHLLDLPTLLVVNACYPAYYAKVSSYTRIDYTEVAWNNGGIASSLGYYSDSRDYAGNSVLFNLLMFSFQEVVKYFLLSFGASVIGVWNNVPHYTFICTTNYLPHTSISLLLGSTWYTNYNTSYISITTGLWDTTPGEYSFICLTGNSVTGNVWIDSFILEEHPISPFLLFSPIYVPGFEEITCDSYVQVDCVDLIFIIDTEVLSTNINFTRIAVFTGSLEESTLTCVNRYGLTLFGSNNGISFVNLTTNSMYGTPSELQAALNSNPKEDVSVLSANGYTAIHEVISRYQFRSGVQKKIVLITDQLPTTKEHSKEETLLTFIRNDVILSVFTNADTYITSLQDRIIGMTGSNRLGYGNYSHCSPTATQDISTVFNAEYIIRNNTEHHAYVELAWLSGGASYDLSYFDVSTAQFCANLITDVFSFATLADTPCSLNGKIYSYSIKVNYPTYTQWKEIDAQQLSSCVDMIFLVEGNPYYYIYDSIDKLPSNGDNCQNRYGLTVVSASNPVKLTVGSNESFWGTPKQLYDALVTNDISDYLGDGLLIVIDSVIDGYTFRTGVIKHIVYLEVRRRSILNDTNIKKTAIEKLKKANIILSVVTYYKRDEIYSLSSTPVKLLAAVRLSNNLIGFGNNINNDTQMDSYSPSTYKISYSDIYENYIDVAWETGGVVFTWMDSIVFNTLMFSYGTNSTFSIPYNNKAVRILTTEVEEIVTPSYVEHQFTCTTTSSPNLLLSLFIDGKWYRNNNGLTTIKVNLPLPKLSIGTRYLLCVANNSLGSDASVIEYNVSLSHLISIGTYGVYINSSWYYTIYCQKDTVFDVPLSILFNGLQYTNNSGSFISVQYDVSNLPSGEHSFICLASNGTYEDMWFETFEVYDLTTVYPFQQFIPGFVNTFANDTFTYNSVSTSGIYTTWTGVNPQTFSSCVDMVFLLYKGASMDDYLPGIRNLISSLPNHGKYCTNR